jgi:hypothetical protein
VAAAQLLQLLQPGDSKKYHDARAGLLVVHWGQQGWAGWGGAGVAIENGCCRSTGTGQWNQKEQNLQMKRWPFRPTAGDSDP